jgi:hypothetical protein
VERDVRHIGIRASYIGSKSTNLDYVSNLNQLPASLIPWTQSRAPYPLFSGVSHTDNGGNANYNALEVDAEHQFRSGLYFKSGWTWAKSLSDDQSTTGAIQNTYNRRSEYGELPWDRRDKWVSVFQYELPAGRSKRYLNSGVGSAILGNWQISGIVLLETGQRFTPSYSGFDAANTNTFSGRPDCIANGNLPSSQRNINYWFNPSAFVLPPAGRWGNCAPNVLVGPGVRNFNAGLVKRIYVREPVSMKFQVDTVNLFNHPNYQNPATNISSPATVARITGQLPISASNDFERDGPRSMRFGLRIEF